MRLRFPLIMVSVAVALVGCTPAESASPTASSSTQQAASPSNAANRVEACDRTSFDLSKESAAVVSVRSRYPGITDDLAAFAVSLLPPGVIEMAGVTPTSEWSLPISRIVRVVNRVGGKLYLKPAADVAPADFAQSIMFDLSSAVMAKGGADVSTYRPYASTVAVDTYIKLIHARPGLGRGPHVNSPSWQEDAAERLRRGDAYNNAYTRPSVPAQLYQVVPEFLAALVQYFGVEFYRPDETSAGQYVTHYPLSA
jgi:hypothetical protein